jgi:uncharacterized phage protein gp47/JayE
MASITEIVAAIRANLAQSDPELDTTVGSTTRKIIDAVAESVSEAYIDSHMLSYQYDIDSKTDADLDAFCNLFGIYRLAARRASGTVTFTRTGALTSTVYIPINTQVNSSTDPSIPYFTLTGGIMSPGVSSVTVPVQAVAAGTEGNLGAGLVTRIVSPLAGVSGVSNVEAITGGDIQETDEELRDRFRKTVFRSMAGTEQMYLGIALNDPDCPAANVIGASKRRREQVQIAAGEAESTVQDALYVYPTSVFVGENIDAGSIFMPGYDYDWNTTVSPPKIEVANADVMPNDLVVELDFEYTPLASRNDPDTGVVHRIDIWCAGTRPVTAIQSVSFQQDRRFNNTPTSTLYRQNYVREDGTHPTNNNVFIPLAYGPIISLPDSLSIGGDSYGRVGSGAVVDFADAYQIVHEDTAWGYAGNSRFGIEFDPANLPTDDTIFEVGTNDTYVYNQVPTSVQDGIDRWRLIGIDALAHAAKPLVLKFNFAVMYDRGVLPGTVNSAIDTALATFIGQLGLGGTLQVSDVLRTVANVFGVDAVRFLSGPEDVPGFVYANRNTYDVGIQLLIDGTVVETYVTNAGWAMDLFFGDNEFPVFGEATKELKAANTFGVA